MSAQATVQLQTIAKPVVTPVASGLLQRCTATTECTECRKKRESTLQRAAVNNSPNHEVPPIVHEVLRSPGQPLDVQTRAFMEPRFRHDFSGVRVHTDAKAAESTRAVNALAYTIGQDVVFGTGQYAPRAAAGQRLLAHELTHVLQQDQDRAKADPQVKLKVADAHNGAELEAETVANHVIEGGLANMDRAESVPTNPAGSGLLQRTPAPPTYGGTTGTRDLSRIRIDAVPDFLASNLTAPRVINAHISDPDVVHMSWELYDPSDQLMPGSFSTLPGHATSTTATFSLQPSHFSGAGFVPGKYLLRCIGRNARHQPIVYADRDFNVLRVDLTTGTALPTTYGDLTFTRYDKTDANPPANPRFSINVELRFLPSNSVTCDEVGFIQAVQRTDAEGRSLHYRVNPEQDARKTPLAWSIDRIAGAPTPFYGTERGGGSVTIPPGKGRFGVGGPTPSAASLIDRPSASGERWVRFESCVTCRTGANRGQVYGCATWGYTSNPGGQVTLMPRSFRQMPSDQFEEARAAWNTWRTSVPAATRPEEAPALRSP